MYTTIQDLLRNKERNALIVIAPTQSVATAVEMMNQNRVGSVLVMEEHVLRGIFTERDVLTRVVGENRVAAETEVSKVMTKMLVKVRGNTSTAEAMKIMTANRFRHLPVIDQDGMVVGLISIGDILRQVIRGLEDEVDGLSTYIRTGSVYPMDSFSR